MCDLGEHVLDEDLGEKHVGITILNYPNHKLWQSRDGHHHKQSLFISIVCYIWWTSCFRRWWRVNYCCERNLNICRKKRKDSTVDSFVSKIERLLNNESICNVNTSNCCSFNYCQHCFPHDKTSIVQNEFSNLSFVNRRFYILDVPKRLH